MRQFIVKQLDYDLTPVAGLALVGHHMQRLVPVFEQIDQALPVKTGVTNSDIVPAPPAASGTGAQTVSRHRDNLWVLGGELIRRR